MNDKKRHAFLHALIFLFVFFCANVPSVFSATSLRISEVMYDPAGTDTNREWIEIYNEGSDAVDLTGMFFLTDGVSSAHHALVAQGSSSLPSHEYAVIVQNVDSFRTDYPGWAGLLFDSSWSGLTASSGKTLVVLDAENTVLDQLTYDPTIGATNDGNSLQRNESGAWVSGVPTPGAAVAAPGGSESLDTDPPATGGGNASSETGGIPSPAPSSKQTKAQEVKTQTVGSLRMQATLNVTKVTTTGIAVPMSLLVLDPIGQQRTSGEIHLAFGDGTFLNTRSFQSLEHVYAFPGTYVVTLEYRTNLYDREPLVSTRASVQVMASRVGVSAINRDGSIEISNAGTVETDLSRWRMQIPNAPTNTSLFEFPSGTVLLPNKKIILPASVHGLSLSERSTVFLLFPSGVLAATYADAQGTQGIAVASVEPMVPVSIKNQTVIKKPEKRIPVASITATALPVAAFALDTETQKKKNSLVPFFFAFVVLVGGAAFALWKYAFTPPPVPSIDAHNQPEVEKEKDEIRIVTPE